MVNTIIQRGTRTPYFETNTVAFSPEASTVEKNYMKAVRHFTRTVTTETLTQKFDRLTLNWKNDSKFESSSFSLLMNPSYWGIIAMGDKALRFIFEDLKKGPDHWFMALAILTGANPITPEIRGNIPAMTEAWLEWGEINGYVTR